MRAAHARFLERVSNEALLRNKLAFSTVTAILRIVLKFARRMAQWRQIDKGQVEAAASLRRFRVSDSAAAVHDAYLGFPITVAGEVRPPFRSFKAGWSTRSRWSLSSHLEGLWRTRSHGRGEAGERDHRLLGRPRGHAVPRAQEVPTRARPRRTHVAPIIIDLMSMII